MSDALARLRADVTRNDVLQAVKEYDRLGAERFFAEHGFGPSRSYELVWDKRAYPTRPCWALLMSWPRGSAWRPVTSRGARPARSRCCGTWGLQSGKRNDQLAKAGPHASRRARAEPR